VGSVEEATVVRREFFVEERKTEYIVEAELSESGYVTRLTIEKIYYPIYPYGNYVKNVIRIDASEVPYKVEIYDVRMDWNGTGGDSYLDLVFDDYCPETPWWLYREEVEKLGSADDVEKFVEGITEYIVETVKESFGKFKELGGGG
jgi:hypothetical protein